MARNSCNSNSDCQSTNSFCDTVIHYCEKCYKHICNTKSHTSPVQCCRNCPDYAKEVGYDCSSVNTTLPPAGRTKTRKAKQPRVSTGRTRTVAKKQQKIKPTLKYGESKIQSTLHHTTKRFTTTNIDMTARNEKIIASGDFSVTTNHVNPWLYTTVILAATFLILIICVAFILIFMKKSKNRKSDGSAEFPNGFSNPEEDMALNNFTGNPNMEEINEKSNVISRRSDCNIVTIDSSYCPPNSNNQKNVYLDPGTNNTGENKNLLDSGINTASSCTT